MNNRQFSQEQQQEILALLQQHNVPQSEIAHILNTLEVAGDNSIVFQDGQNNVVSLRLDHH
ncbi:MAG: hypothetical protein JNM36_15315, partial [Chitinophagales bacterium]|nr:hypothetical protein [Chitinophagales bacterium]